MNQELQNLYQEVIIDHNNHPCNFRKMEGATVFAEGYNPMCGDRYIVYLKIKDDIIEDISFEGEGCAISKASASIMTSELLGKNIEESLKVFQSVHNMLTDESMPGAELDDLGKIAVLSGVRMFPMRVKCASLAWHAMKSAVFKNHS
ncbi:MAG: SUF system NifU family Fe-S cluster assembly protein [Pseudomonadota bacterium]